MSSCFCVVVFVVVVWCSQHDIFGCVLRQAARWSLCLIGGYAENYPLCWSTGISYLRMFSPSLTSLVVSSSLGSMFVTIWGHLLDGLGLPGGHCNVCFIFAKPTKTFGICTGVPVLRAQNMENSSLTRVNRLLCVDVSRRLLSNHKFNPSLSPPRALVAKVFKSKMLAHLLFTLTIPITKVSWLPISFLAVHDSTLKLEHHRSYWVPWSRPTSAMR